MTVGAGTGVGAVGAIGAGVIGAGVQPYSGVDPLISKGWTLR